VALQEPGPRPSPPRWPCTAGGRGRVGSEGRECSAKGRIFSCHVGTIRILGKGDTHVHVEAWWAIAHKIPPINISPQQPLRSIRVGSGPNLRHAVSLAPHRQQPTHSHGRRSRRCPQQADAERASGESPKRSRSCRYGPISVFWSAWTSHSGTSRSSSAMRISPPQVSAASRRDRSRSLPGQNGQHCLDAGFDRRIVADV
jgi:hypothetical protein